jgi:hypothetical protein
MTNRRLRLSKARVAFLLAAAAPILAQAADSVPETHLYWGNTHLHTSYSWDAYGTGNNSVTPDLAYRFARGIPILSPLLHNTIRIDRPLDFLAVTDHAILMGTQPLLDRRDPRLLSTDWGKKLLAIHLKDPVAGAMRQGGQLGVMDGPESKVAGRKQFMDQVFAPQIREATWDDEIAAAEKNNIPGKFTTLIGWEWTATPGGKNLHRCVISDATAEQARKFIPYSVNESLRPEDLWAWLEKTKQQTGTDFIAMPHNSNLSGGLMFDVVDSDGRPFSAEYARLRMRWEVDVEITQSKGTSEILPQLAPTDEFANFEIWQRLLTPVPQPPSPHDYVRPALLEGLSMQKSIGVNPYKFGFVGGTDSHTGLVAVDESNFLGDFGDDPTPADRDAELKPDAKRRFIFPAWELSASGMTAVWATENSRPAIFQALKRKEVYGTSGTRIALRVFGGYHFDPNDASARDIARIGYAKGVPMGGDLTDAPRNSAPTLLIFAARDPLSGNLDRIQVIKGWMDAQGKTQQRIYNAAWSGARQLDARGNLAPVGNTVDEKTASFSNTIGAAQLATVWKDPDFKSDQLAFYYVRVLEIPTPRHSLYEAVALGVPVSDTHQPASIQERAYSSPIWYTPASRP